VREKIHLTLFFVGAIERARLPALEALAATLPVAEFVLHVDTLAYWRHNNIVWAGARVCPEALTALAADLRAALAREGVYGEDRPYVPHVTLVRNAKRAPRSTPAPTAAWHARDFVLVEVAPAGAGVRYEVRGRWPLSRGRDEKK
jgi:2'-5' RNA ligase